MPRTTKLPTPPVTLMIGVRIALRLAILLGFAAFGEHGYAAALVALGAMAAVLCAGTAAIRGEALNGPRFTHWDEAAVYGCLAIVATAV
jgi:hypothetical protein